MDENLTPKNHNSMEDLVNQIKTFVAERDWQQFHSPKNLATAVSVESSELLELFMWMTPEESEKLSPEKLQKVREEVGDVLICLANFAQRLGIDPLDAALQKLKNNAEKYPVERSKGIAKKYNEL